MSNEHFIDAKLYFVVFESEEQDEVGQYVICDEHIENINISRNLTALLKPTKCLEIKEITFWEDIQVKISNCSSDNIEQKSKDSTIPMFNINDTICYKSVYIIVFVGKNKELFSRCIALSESILGIESILKEVKSMYVNINNIISVTKFTSDSSNGRCFLSL